MRLATYCHQVFGFFTLERRVSKDYSAEQINEAILLILQSGE